MNTSPPALSIELLLPSELGFEKVAREVIGAFAQRLGFDRERIEDIKTALCEACVNAIEHGNQRAPGLQVRIACTCDGQRLMIEICDEGVKRYETGGTPDSIDRKVAGDVPTRGMGLLMIAQLADEIGFAEDAFGGNRFWFTIKCQAHPTANLPLHCCRSPR